MTLSLPMINMIAGSQEIGGKTEQPTAEVEMIAVKGAGSDIIGMTALKETDTDAHRRGKAIEGTDQELLKRKRDPKINHLIQGTDKKRKKLKMAVLDGTLHLRKRISKGLYWQLLLRLERRLVPLKRLKVCFRILGHCRWLRRPRLIGNYM